MVSHGAVYLWETQIQTMPPKAGPTQGHPTLKNAAPSRQALRITPIAWSSLEPSASTPWASDMDSSVATPIETPSSHAPWLKRTRGLLDRLNAVGARRVPGRGSFSSSTCPRHLSRIAGNVSGPSAVFVDATLFLDPGRCRQTFPCPLVVSAKPRMPVLPVSALRCLVQPSLDC